MLADYALARVCSGTTLVYGNLVIPTFSTEFSTTYYPIFSTESGSSPFCMLKAFVLELEMCVCSARV